MYISEIKILSTSEIWNLEEVGIIDFGFLSLFVAQPMGWEDMFDWVAFTGSAPELLERRKRKRKSPTVLAYVLSYTSFHPTQIHKHDDVYVSASIQTTLSHMCTR